MDSQILSGTGTCTPHSTPRAKDADAALRRQASVARPHRGPIKPQEATLKTLLAGIALLCLAAVANAAVAAQATYVYNSPNYTNASAPYATTMNISGRFTTASPLPANLTDALIGAGQMNLVTSWSFSDGIQTFTSLNSQPIGGTGGGFKVSTDATGAITTFSIALVNPAGTNTTGQLVNAIFPDSASQIASYGASCINSSSTGGCNLTVGNGKDAGGKGGTFTLAPAPTTYTYSGTQYTSASAPYQAGMGLTGSFTTAAPLAANLSNAPIAAGGSNQVIAWSFNDGVQIFTELNSRLFGSAAGSFTVSTDAKGAITNFSIVLQTPTDVAAVGQSMNYVGFSATGTVAAAHGFICAGINNGICAVDAFQAGAGSNVGTFAAPPTRYVYTGTPFTTANPPYTKSMKITGQFTTSSPLPPNLTTAAIGPSGLNLVQNWSFNDGVQTLTFGGGNTNSQLWAGDGVNFSVSTDATGAIVGYQIQVYGPTGATAVGQSVDKIVLTPYVQEGDHNAVCGTVINGTCSALASNSQFATSTGMGTLALGSPVSPPTVTIGAATAITATSATLNGMVNDSGADTSASFDYGTTASFGTNVAATPASILAGSGSTAVSFAASSLACGTTYHFRVTANNGIGGAVNGADQMFTTTPCSGAGATTPAPALSRPALGLLALLLAVARRFARRRI